MHWPDGGGLRSMRTPSASSTSAEPERLVAERLPCLATAQPAAAAMSAAVVETLNVERPPPVPAVSTRSVRLVATGVANERIVRARPASSSTVSPFVRSAIEQPGDLRLGGLAGHDDREDLGGLVGAEIATGGDGVDRAGEDGVGHRVRRD